MLQVASRWHCEAMQPDESSIRAVHRECQTHHPRPEKAQTPAPRAMMVPALCRAWPRVMQRFKSLHNATCSNGSHQRASEGQSEGNTTGSLSPEAPLAPPRSEPAESRLGRGPWAP